MSKRVTVRLSDAEVRLFLSIARALLRPGAKRDCSGFTGPLLSEKMRRFLSRRVSLQRSFLETTRRT